MKIMEKFLNYTEAEAMEAVKEKWSNLRFIKNQTEAICMEAVKQNASALPYVEEYYESVYESVTKIASDSEYHRIAN